MRFYYNVFAKILIYTFTKYFPEYPSVSCIFCVFCNLEDRSMLLHFESKLALFCDRIQPRTSVSMPTCGIPFESYFQHAVL